MRPDCATAGQWPSDDCAPAGDTPHCSPSCRSRREIFTYYYIIFNYLFHSRFVGLVIFVGRQNFTQLHVVAARHLRHGGRQLGGGNATMLARQLLAAAILLTIAALALHLDQLLAGRLRAVALMADGGTFVATEQARLGAALAALLARLLALAIVAGPDALVSAA